MSLAKSTCQINSDTKALGFVHLVRLKKRFFPSTLELLSIYFTNSFLYSLKT